MARKKSSQGRKAKKKRQNAPAELNGAAQGSNGSAPNGSRPSSKHGGAGPVPNLYWGAVSMDQLRATPRFLGLPEPEAILPLPSPCAARYLRQDSPMWRQLHTGVLTTGLLKEALGLREPRAARVVGGRKESSHAPLLAAFQHLRHPAQLPPLHPDPVREAAWRERLGGALAEGLRGLRQLRELGRQQQQQQQQEQGQGQGLANQGPQQHNDGDREGGGARGRADPDAAAAAAQTAAAAASLSGPAAAVVATGGAEAALQSRTSAVAAAAQPTLSSLVTGGGTAAVAGMEAGVIAAAVANGRGTQAGHSSDWPASSQDHYRLSSTALSNGGLVGVRCAWGKVQEGAALEQLLHIFPVSTLHEVGLCCLPSDTTAPWPQLPPLAASPDALIAHHLTLTDPRVVQCLREQLATPAATAATGAAVTNAADPSASPLAGSGAALGTSACGGGGGGTQSPPRLLQPHEHLQRLLRELFENVEMDTAGGGGNETDDAEDGAEGGHGGGGGGSGRESRRTDGDGEDDTGGSSEDSDGDEAESYGVHVSVGGDEADAGAVGGSDGDAGSSDGGGEGSDMADDVNGLPEGPEGVRGCGTGVACATASPLPTTAPGSDGKAEDYAGAASRPPPRCTPPPGVQLPGPGPGGVDGRSCPGQQGSSGTKALKGAQSPLLPTPDLPAGGGAPPARAPPAEVVSREAMTRVVLDARLPVVLLCGRCGGTLHDCRNALAMVTVMATPAPAAAGATALPVDGCGPRCACAADPNTGSGASGGCKLGDTAVEDGGHVSVYAVLREVVEVKSTCPYGIRQVRRGGKGRVVSEVVLSDRGPRPCVAPAWVPQLQLHMRATGCGSGLLVSSAGRQIRHWPCGSSQRSATKGTTVFRMLRDDPYLDRMMGLLERFHTEYVLPGRPPPADMFSRLPEYAAFLSATARLARTARPLTAPQPWRPPAGAALDRDVAFVRQNGAGRG